MGMRDQMEDLKYLLSSDNKSSRGFYIMLTIVAVILVLVGIGMEVAAVIGITTGGMRIFGFVFLPVLLILLFVIVKVLSRD